MFIKMETLNKRHNTNRTSSCECQTLVFGTFTYPSLFCKSMKALWVVFSGYREFPVTIIERRSL